ncbi:hypothetical protein EGW08_007176, partial [Elysia chlorotica]
RMGLQPRPELLMYTMPFLDTVAGEALSMLCGSKMILQLGAMGIRSPLAKVKVLLSSRTELRFSIQMASTGPSSTSQTCSPVEGNKTLGLFLVEKMPSVQSLVATSSRPNICGAVIALGFIRHSLWGSPQSVMAFISMWIQQVLPAPLGPRAIIP